MHGLLILLGLTVLLIPFREKLRSPVVSVMQVLRGRKTIEDRVDQFGALVRKRLEPEFERINVSYPPDELILVGLKEERVLEVWVSNPPKFLKSYPILGASGHLGPKLLEGDRQVPEGLYRIESLNPNSMYHLSLRVNYPNEFDREKGRLDGRENLGGDIMIHGKNCSIGCLAMGDEAAEDLFVLSAAAGIDNISAILSPVDFRKESPHEETLLASTWRCDLYRLIQAELLKLRLDSSEVESQ